MNVEIIKKNYSKFNANKIEYTKIKEYYNGITDAISDYKMVTERSNLKVNCNFIKKFIKEEVSYSVGNDITYTSKSGNDNIIKDININFETLSDQHDIELMKTMLKFNLAYEIIYIKNGEFKSRVVSPLEGFLITEDANITGFGREYTVEDDMYLDIYEKDYIYHCKISEKGDIDEYKPKTENIFGFVPVGVATVGTEGVYETLYNDIKGLQDAYETNLSDLTNEISDFRNAYLTLTGAQIDETKAGEMKKCGILQTNDPNAKFQWLIKNLNDSFIQNTLLTLEDKMYQLSHHINHNEKMQSNLSGVALRSRLISLEEKCKINQRAVTDCIKVRLKALFVWLNKLYGTKYDWRDININFTPNIPQDDQATADIIAKVRDLFPDETWRSRFSWCDNPGSEGEKLKKQQSEQMELINLSDYGDDPVE